MVVVDCVVLMVVVWTKEGTVVEAGVWRLVVVDVVVGGVEDEVTWFWAGTTEEALALFAATSIRRDVTASSGNSQM